MTRYGATAMARHAKKNPTEVLRSLREAHPTASEDKIFKDWFEIVRNDDELTIAALRHTFQNIWTSLERDSNPPTPLRPITTLSERIQRQREKDELSKCAKAQVIKAVLSLSSVMPNGRTLYRNTGLEIGTLSGDYAIIAKKVGKALVGSVIKTDAALQKLIAAGRK
jgi:hypothetical protein